jgi:23S rRNA (cytosine1962-C5)-methyltransferase
VSSLKRAGELFDCVFVDPPFFSQTEHGTIDLVSQGQRVINKARPLVGHGGTLVAINNALFLSGADYLRQLEDLCADGYLSIDELIPVPADFTGFSATRSGQPPVDPAPFNHSTKIAVLKVRRKDGRVPGEN